MLLRRASTTHYSTLWRLQRAYYSTQGHLVHLKTEKVGKNEVATLTLNSPPVNGFTLALLQELNSRMDELIFSPSIRGIVITSAIPVFSAGIDFKVLYRPNPTQLKTFWSALQSVWKLLYSSPLPTVAAINGHCLAGGTVLAASCDHRVMHEGSNTIGVTAVKVGMMAPFWFQKTLINLMGQRRTEMALQQGTAFTPREAQTIGLVDEIYSGDNLVRHCLEKVLPPYLNVFQEARAGMKLSLRASLIAEFERTRDEETDSFVNYVMQPSVQQAIADYMERFKAV